MFRRCWPSFRESNFWTFVSLNWVSHGCISVGGDLFLSELTCSEEPLDFSHKCRLSWMLERYFLTQFLCEPEDASK